MMTERLVADGNWGQTDTQYHEDVVRISYLIPELASGSATSVLADMGNGMVRPRHGDIGDLVVNFLKGDHTRNAEDERSRVTPALPLGA